jgi:hypothetical protein
MVGSTSDVDAVKGMGLPAFFIGDLTSYVMKDKDKATGRGIPATWLLPKYALQEAYRNLESNENWKRSIKNIINRYYK